MLRSLPNNASGEGGRTIQGKARPCHAPQTRVRPASQLTMEAIAKRAKVGKPTLYKRWPSKAALIMTMFYERLVGKLEAPQASTVEEAVRAKMRRLIKEFNASVLSDARSERGVKAGEMFCGAFESAPMTVIALFTTCAVSSWES